MKKNNNTNVNRLTKKMMSFFAILVSFATVCSCSSNGTKFEKFLEGTEWSVWKSDDSSIEIYISNYNVKKGLGHFVDEEISMSCEYDLDAFIGVATSRPWKMKIENNQNEHIAYGFDLKIEPNKKEKQILATSKNKSLLLTNYEWKKEDFDIRCLRLPLLYNSDLDIGFKCSTARSNKYCSDLLIGSYLNDALMLQIQNGQKFEITFNEIVYEGDYYRDESNVVFNFSKEKLLSMESITFKIMDNGNP